MNLLVLNDPDAGQTGNILVTLTFTNVKLLFETVNSNGNR